MFTVKILHIKTQITCLSSSTRNSLAKLTDDIMFHLVLYFDTFLTPNSRKVNCTVKKKKCKLRMFFGKRQQLHSQGTKYVEISINSITLYKDLKTQDPISPVSVAKYSQHDPFFFLFWASLVSMICRDIKQQNPCLKHRKDPGFAQQGCVHEVPWRSFPSSKKTKHRKGENGR